MKTIRPGEDYIPIAPQNISEEDKKILHEVVEKEQYAAGEYAQKLTKVLTHYFGSAHAFLTNSGSSALLAALSAAREFSKGKYVITSALGFPTTVAAIYQAGFQPWYLDCDADTLNVDEDEVLDCLEEDDVAGVILAHTLGFPYDSYSLNKELKSRRPDAFLIEDNCDAWGAEVCDRRMNWHLTGHGGDMAAVSMYPAHHITAGEGGAVICNNPKYSAAVRSYINWGRDCVCEPGQDNVCGKRLQQDWDCLPHGYDHKYVYSRLGYNLKMTEFSAALGFSQLNQLEFFVKERRQNYQYIRQGLAQFPWLQVLPKYPPVRSSPFGVPILLHPNLDCSHLIQYLEEHKIATRRIFGGNLLRQKAFRDLPSRCASFYAGANLLMENAFWIGCWPGWKDQFTQYVVKSLKEYEQEHLK